MFKILLLIHPFYSWVQMCASHVERVLISYLKSLSERIIQSKVGSYPL